VQEAVIGRRCEQISRLIHAGPVLKADHDDGTARGAGDEGGFVVVVPAFHDGGEIGAQVGAGEGFHGAVGGIAYGESKVRELRRRRTVGGVNPAQRIA